MHKKENFPQMGTIMLSENCVRDKLMKVSMGRVANKSNLGAIWAIGYKTSMILNNRGAIFHKLSHSKMLEHWNFMAHIPKTIVAKFHMAV